MNEKQRECMKCRGGIHQVRKRRVINRMETMSMSLTAGG